MLPNLFNASITAPRCGGQRRIGTWEIRLHAGCRRCYFGFATMASDTARLLVPSRRKENYVAVTCPYTDCKASIEYLAPTPEAVAAVPISTTTFSVTCTSCGRNFDPPGAPDILRKIRGSAKDGKREGTGKRRIGTDERPLDMS